MLKLIGKGEQYVTNEVKLISGVVFTITFVYAKTNVGVRREPWDYLVCTSSNATTPWLVMGDFKAILDFQE